MRYEAPAIEDRASIVGLLTGWKFRHPGHGNGFEGSPETSEPT